MTITLQKLRQMEKPDEMKKIINIIGVVLGQNSKKITPSYTILKSFIDNLIVLTNDGKPNIELDKVLEATITNSNTIISARLEGKDKVLDEYNMFSIIESVDNELVDAKPGSYFKRWMEKIVHNE